MATGRTRNHDGVGRKLTGEELSRKKTEIARLELDWAGEKNVCSAYACPALRLLGIPALWLGRMRGPQKKTGPVKKEWQVGRDNNSITEAADGGARLARGDGAVVLPTLLSRADGQLTRAGQYYFHLGLRPSSKDFNYKAAPHPQGTQRPHSAAHRNQGSTRSSSAPDRGCPRRLRAQHAHWRCATRSARAACP